MSLADELEKLAGEATPGRAHFDHDWHRFPTIFIGNEKIATMEKSGLPNRDSRTRQHEANASLIVWLWNRRDEIVSALRGREAVVAMLKQPPDKVFGLAEGYCDLIDGTGGGHEGVVRDLRMFLRFFADAIEAGEHLA